MATYRLRRPREVDLVFDGTIIAHVSQTTGDLVRIIRIYHTDTGRFVYENVLRNTADPEEPDRTQAKVGDTPWQLRSKMRTRVGPDKRRALLPIAKAALEIAQETTGLPFVPSLDDDVAESA